MNLVVLNQIHVVTGGELVNNSLHRLVRSLYNFASLFSFEGPRQKIKLY